MTAVLSPLQAVIIFALAMIALWWAEKERNRK
jgi:nitrogen fixation-related uncharacterized protein